VRILSHMIVRIGMLSDHRKVFWDTVWPLLRAGRVEEAINIALVSHHLITFTREALTGAQNASFYAPAERPLQAA
jgi:hypothetical protein